MFENSGGNRDEEVNGLSSEESKQLADKIRERLVVDKMSALEELIDLSVDYIDLEEDGKVHIKKPETLKGADLVSLVLIGKRLARLGGLSTTDVVDISEISEATGQKEDVAIARLSDLRKSGTIESPERGKHRIKSLARARAILLSLDATNARKRGD